MCLLNGVLYVCQPQTVSEAHFGHSTAEVFQGIGFGLWQSFNQKGDPWFLLRIRSIVQNQPLTSSPAPQCPSSDWYIHYSLWMAMGTQAPLNPSVRQQWLNHRETVQRKWSEVGMCTKPLFQTCSPERKRNVLWAVYKGTVCRYLLSHRTERVCGMYSWKTYRIKACNNT